MPRGGLIFTALRASLAESIVGFHHGSHLARLQPLMLLSVPSAMVLTLPYPVLGCRVLLLALGPKHPITRIAADLAERTTSDSVRRAAEKRRAAEQVPLGLLVKCTVKSTCQHIPGILTIDSNIPWPCCFSHRPQSLRRSWLQRAEVLPLRSTPTREWSW